jgi:predicted TIM-barrel fold metal-dependent hydrolase
MKGLTAGTLSFTFSPSGALQHVQNEGSQGSSADEKPGNELLPSFFDCNKYVGPGFPKNPDFPGLKDLLKHMDRLGIQRAVVWHTSALDIRPMQGNEELIRELGATGSKDRIIPSFIIAPGMISEPQTMDRLHELVTIHGIHAFHFFQRKFGWSLKDIEPVVHALQPVKPVLFLDTFEVLGGSIEPVLEFSEKFRDIPVVLTNAMWSFYSKIYRLMDARSNIFLDTSLVHTYGTIEHIIQRYGVRRLIFGCGYKSNNGASVASLVHSRISAEHAGFIAHGNLEHLLGIGSSHTTTKPVTGNRLWHRLLRKQPPGPEIIDSHTHFCSTLLNWEDHHPVDFNTHVKYSLESMDSLGVRSMIIAEYKLSIPDSPSAKTFLEERLDKYGGRFRGYFCAQAFLPQYVERLKPCLDEIFSRSYYVGFKMHNDHWQIPVTDPCFDALWEYADKHRLPILLHTWNSKFNAPGMLKEIVPRYPNAVFILGHSGNTDREDGEKLVQQYDNVYLEWCGSFLNPADWKESFDRIGNERIIYGSDGVSWETLWGHGPAWEMGRLLSMDIPDETLLPVLAGNINKILAMKQ